MYLLIFILQLLYVVALLLILSTYLLTCTLQLLCELSLCFRYCLSFLQLNTTSEVPEIPRPPPEEAPTFAPEEEEEEAIPEIPVKGTAFLPENYLKALFSSSKDLHL